ncbi:MAG: helix-turn-helix domain-containing protein [Pseudomonadota bacterium]
MPSINIPAVKAAMSAKGLSGRKLAEVLSVSPQTVTNWLTSAAFPHPSQLLKLALNLRIPFEELVLKEAPGANEPRVAARARQNRQLSDEALAELKGMGKLLEQLAEHLPFDTLESPPRLAAPVVEYEYLQRVSKKIRGEIGLDQEEPVLFKNLVSRFSAHKAVLIPVFWGKKDGHENAIHVLLPKSGTTWVYLNLDTYLPDFNFWMAHELGHVYSPSLGGIDAEKFADAFAGALLFPSPIAKKTYMALVNLGSPTKKCKVLNDYAQDYGISSYSVFKEANNFAASNRLEAIKIPPSLLHGNRHSENDHHGTVSELLWNNTLPNSEDYIAVAQTAFATVFFETLSKFLVAEEKPASFVQAVLDIPLSDARALHLELA